MSKIYGGRSKYLVKKDLKYFLIGNALLPIVFLISMFFVIINALKLESSLTFILLFAVLAMFFVSKMTKEVRVVSRLANKKSNKYFRGWRGEDLVFDILKKLSDDYTVFYDVNLYDCGNIDFVVLGPCGLLVVEVKSHWGNITFENGRLLRNGHPFKEKDFIAQVKNEVSDLKHFLKEKIQKDIFVKPIIVFSSKHANAKFGLNPINNVFVVQKEFLIKLIESLPEAISRDEAGGIERELIKYIGNSRVKAA